MRSPLRKKKTTASGTARTGKPEQAHRRLQDLFEISKLFASFENVEQAFDTVLGIAARTLPLRSAILLELDDGRSRMIAWHCEGQSSETMRAVKEHAATAYADLIGAASTVSLELHEEAGKTTLPRQGGTQGNLAKRLFVMPLVAVHRPPFGTVQLEGAQPFDEMDLMFANAIANQLAVALDRDHTWRQVQHAARVREQILAIVSQDLRNPLGTVLLEASALAKKRAPEQRPGEIPEVQNIQRAAGHMLRLISDLLDFASIEAGHLAIKRKPQDPGAMIQETLATFESVAGEKRLRLTAHVEPHLAKVDCDRDRILQVLSNLVGNAIKATAPGGHVTLRVEAQGKDLVFGVSDSGPGIRAEDVKHLFERYGRSGQARYKGTGLGLAIAKGIVRVHGGRIWAESKPGLGATFLFAVPLSTVSPSQT